VDEARAVLARLERIDELERRLLAEVCALVREGERWAAAEGGDTAAAEAALARCRSILARSPGAAHANSRSAPPVA
jgi:hypothetical protein